MWIVGHTALGYLLARAGFSLGRKRLRPDMVLMIFFFSNLIDALHFGWLRDLTHNPLGTALFTAMAILVLARLGLLQKGDGTVLAGVSGLHAAGDLLFGGYLPLYPFSAKVYYAWPWNSVENLLFESALGVLFVAVFLSSRDHGEVRAFAAGQRKLLFGELHWRNALDRRFMHIYMFTLYYLLLVGQFTYYLLWKQLADLLAARWYFWLFLCAFVLVLAAISAAAFHGETRVQGSGSRVQGDGGK